MEVSDSGEEIFITQNTFNKEASVIKEANMRCSECGVKKDDLRRCTGCYLVQYCSRKCQSKHWTGHKAECEARRSNLTPCGQDCKAQEGDTHGLDAVSPFVIGPDQMDASNFKHCAAADFSTSSDKNAVKPGANKPIDENGGASGRRGICCYCENTGLMRTCSRCKMAKYCDKTCQKRHWPKHGSACFKQTTAMENEQAKHSRYLFESLDSFGLSEDNRKLTIKGITVSEILQTVTRQLVHSDYATYTFGSVSEGTMGLMSDIDSLQCDEGIPVVDRPDDGPASGPCLLIVSGTKTHTGYTKLHCMEDRHPSILGRCDNKIVAVDGRGRVMRNNYVPEHIYDLPSERNGPAGTIPMTHCSLDVVYAYRYRKWPAIAMEWKTRGRCYNWPSTEVIKKLCNFGCFLVPKGHFQSSDVDFEWKFSFSLQERELMRSLNAVQFKCYVLLKYIKEKITVELGESITSYHCKTCIFYAIESKTADFWTPDNLITCLLFCLSILQEWLEKEFCPNYFIREDNMFEKMLHGGLLAKTANLLETIKSEFIFDLKTCGIGSAMRSANTEANMIPANQNINVANFVLKLSLSIIRILLQSTHVKNDLVPCIEAHLKLIRKLTNTKTVTEHTKEQTTEAIDLIVPYLYTSLASHEAAQLIQLTTTGPETERIKLSMNEHIERGLKSCLISCQLKVAAIHYMLGDYEASEQILSAAPLLFHKDTRKNVCICSDWNIFLMKGSDANFGSVVCVGSDERVDDQMLSGIISETVPLSEILKSSFSTCVMFLPTEKAIAPSAMLYENPVVHEAGRIDLGVGNNWAVVDFNAFGYYMQYVVYDKLGRTDEKRLAVKYLKQLIKEDEMLAHKTLASKLLDWILETEKTY